MTPITKGREWIPLVAIVVTGAVARLAAIRQPMRFDEAVSWAYYVGRSWGTIVTTYTYPNNHVFYSLLAKLTGGLFKYQPWALRLPALIAGIAILPLLHSVGTRFTDSRSALLATALAAGSLELALYSTNARGYSLVTAAFLGLLIVGHDLVQRPSTTGFALLALLGGLGLYTVPTMLYPLGTVATWLLLNARRQVAGERGAFASHTCAAMAAAGAIAAALYTPLVMHSGLGALLHNRFVAPSSWSQFGLDVVPMVVDTFGAWVQPLPRMVGFVLVLLAFVGMARRAEETRASLTLATALWCGVLLLATHRAPFTRVWLFLLPLFYLAVARGTWAVIDALARRRMAAPAWSAVGVAVLLSALLIGTHAVQSSDDTGLFHSAPEVSALIGPQLRPSDRVLAPLPLNGPLLYYFTRAGRDSASLTRPFNQTRRIFVVLDPPHGHDIAWAIAVGMVDTQYFLPPQRIGTYPDAEVWLAPLRGQ